MKSSQKVIGMIFIVLLVHSLIIGVGAIDTTKVGVKQGDTFVYDFTDTIPKDRQKLDPQLLYVRDSDNHKVYLSDGQKLTISIDTPPSSDTYVIFNFESIDGDVKIQDKSDQYGQILLFKDWAYWRTEITSDTKLFATNENVSIVDNSTHFGSTHVYGINVSSGGSLSMHASFIYDKTTGMINDLSYDLYFDYGNSTEEYNYGINLISYTPGSNNSDLTLILVITVITIVGFLAYWRYRGQNSSNPQLNKQYQNYQHSQQNQLKQSTSYNPTDQPQEVNQNQAKFCSNCGSTIIPNNIFCFECGRKIL